MTNPLDRASDCFCPRFIHLVAPLPGDGINCLYHSTHLNHRQGACSCGLNGKTVPDHVFQVTSMPPLWKWPYIPVINPWMRTTYKDVKESVDEHFNLDKIDAQRHDHGDDDNNN